MRLWVAKVDQDTVAHVFGDKARETAGRLGDTAVIGTDNPAQVLGTKRTDSGVEPTRSQNMTVSCRRSARRKRLTGPPARPATRRLRGRQSHRAAGVDRRPQRRRS